ncbi:hypothetical protein DV735_g3109, partial [Chaetothyriales sp. CBS 134920]
MPKAVQLTVAAGVAVKAQFATYSSDGGAAISVNIPSDTSSGSSQTIYFQISAPSDTQWVGFGQGDSMVGSNMFVVYSASDSNVTVSPRSGTGFSLPGVNADAQISVLEGTGIASDGSYVANVRCDNCLSWSGGTLDPKSTSSNWIWAIKKGDPLNDASTSASFSIHDSTGEFTLDLTSGTGGSSSNPFIASTTSSGGNSSSTTSGVSTPTSTSGMNSGSQSRGSSNTSQVRVAHAILMSLVFLVLFPIAALTLYIPYAEKVRYIHGPLQLLSLIISIIGLALGVYLGQKVRKLDAYHQIIGYLVVGILILFQPALGILQHLHYRKTGTKSPMGIAHRWLGRTMIILGVINGGLGFMQSGPVGSKNVPNYSVIAYSVVAGVVLFLYISILAATSFTAKHPRQPRGEKLNSPPQGYNLQQPERSNTQRYRTPINY